MSKKRFVIAADVALLLARKEAKIFDAALVAPTLLRSQALSHLYSAVRKGDLGWKEAEKQMDYLRKLQIRFLGDRVMQQRAWDIASKLDLSETYLAEYIAVTQLQADALVTLNPSLLSAARHFVSVAAIDDLTAEES